MSITLNTNNVDTVRKNEMSPLMMFDVRDKSIIRHCDAYGTSITLAALAHEIIQ